MKLWNFCNPFYSRAFSRKSNRLRLRIVTKVNGKDGLGRLSTHAIFCYFTVTWPFISSRHISTLTRAIQNMLQLFRNTFCHWSNTLQMLVGRRGLEPRTIWLKVRKIFCIIRSFGLLALVFAIDSHLDLNLSQANPTAIALRDSESDVSVLTPSLLRNMDSSSL